MRFKYNWDGYFICPHCKRIHSNSNVKEEYSIVLSQSYIDDKDIKEFIKFKNI